MLSLLQKISNLALDIQTKVDVIKKSVEESFTVNLTYKDSEEQRTVSVATLKLAKNNNIILGAWDLNAQGYRSFNLGMIKNIAINNSLEKHPVPKNYIDDINKINIANFSVTNDYSGINSPMTESQKREILSENLITSRNIFIIKSIINHNTDDSLNETYKIVEFKYLSKTGELNTVSGFLPSSVTYNENTTNLIVTGTVGATNEDKSYIRSYNFEKMNDLSVHDCKSEDIFDAMENTPSSVKITKSTIISWIGMACLVAIGIFTFTNK